MANKATNTIIRYNIEKGGIEVQFPKERKLSTEECATLKELGFSWHKKLYFWYTRYTEQKLGLIKASFIGKDAKFPAKTQEEKLAAKAAELEKQRAEQPKAPRQSASAARQAETNTLLQTLLENQQQTTQAILALAQALTAK